MNQKLVFDLFCGLGGWTEAFLAEGYQAVGFDIEAHDYGSGGYPGELVLCDIRTLNGRDLVVKYGVPKILVASPPCQEYSYMAMPWKLAKEKIKKIEADPKERERLNDLFYQCWRIQREVSEAAGHHVPMVVENVRGAQRWVGRARWNFGSFYLLGDVPALMPIPTKSVLKNGVTHRSDGATNFHGVKVPNFRFDGSGKSFQTASVSGLKVPSEGGRRTNVGTGARFITLDCGEGIKQKGSGREWFAGDGKISRITSSKSVMRKKASAEIAKIPTALATWIAKVYA